MFCGLLRNFRKHLYAFILILFSFLFALYTWSFQSWLIGYISPITCGCHISFQLLVPPLIIVTFILFSCVPNLLNSFHQFYSVEVKVRISYVLGVFYRIGLLVDPITYIYYWKLFPKKTNHNQFVKNAINQEETSPLQIFFDLYFDGGRLSQSMESWSFNVLYSNKKLCIGYLVSQLNRAVEQTDSVDWKDWLRHSIGNNGWTLLKFYKILVNQ